MSRVVTWEPDSPSLPRSVIAIGVFDGVHLGHQTLLADTIADAAARSAASVAVTFDRDPDQVITPDAAAPQLLTLEHKLAFIAECGIDTVVVVPFTPGIAALSPTAFLDSVVAPAVDVVAIHVGADFRFGAKAAGDLITLETWARSRDIAVSGHELVAVDGAPVTSTRIRTLVAAGDIVGATGLLGRPHRVVGTVVQGRAAGRTLGFPTANLEPVPFAALPADGVYAGRALLEDGSVWPAAISVGTPPTFPDARDYLEVHLIGFDGDLYGKTLTVEFLARLRAQRAFHDEDELSRAIRADVGKAAAIGAGEVATEPGEFEDDWTEVAVTTLFGPVAAMAGNRTSGVALTMPLDAQGIPYRWEPFDPQDAAPLSWRAPVQFHLLVPSGVAAEASVLLAGDSGEDEGTLRPDDAGTENSTTDEVDYWEREDLTDEDLVDDPAALAAAQAAVNEARSIGPFSAVGPTETMLEDVEPWTWVFLVEGFAPGPIEFLSQALNDAEIETLWEPFPPEKRAAFWGRTSLTVYVPAIQLRDAQLLAAEIGAWDELEDVAADRDAEDSHETGHARGSATE